MSFSLQLSGEEALQLPLKDDWPSCPTISESQAAVMSLPPGVVSRALTWQEVCNAVACGTEESLGRLGRLQEDIEVYKAFTDKVKAEYSSVADYVKIHKLQYGQTRSDDGKKKATDISALQPGECLWIENDFPYALEDGLVHCLIWAHSPLSSDEIAAQCQMHCPGCEYVTFVNPQALASIPSVWHAHVMYRNQEFAASISIE
eukprot:CAMPEP_0117695434 /NCGR_PEP_ID=MMETSP0804-20121206/28138_1 /TAXON_ID=1074897 /ORGANISM="Tetraselmis astigmatica, Strain CCMP880" /LENGTH=202 /DNA_ID=CAMNT_0005509507 /DNA_START=193 /DNA_END=802 /DNA_ORIENTATION=-